MTCESVAVTATYDKYFYATYRGLEAMRHPVSGLVADSVTASLDPLHDPTSPSNIGFDLLVQLEAREHEALQRQATKNIERILLTISNFSYHHGSGLFFARYTSDGEGTPDWYLSSIDNLHLAFALWVIANAYPEDAEKQRAQALFSRMDFSLFYNPTNGLVAGGAFFRDGRWIREDWHYDYLGSEGRSLYALGWAIGLFQGAAFLKEAFASLIAEMNGPILRLWDGGAFQLLLPRLLINEERYSATLKESFLAYADFVLHESTRLGYPVPASFSACQVSLTTYSGKVGSPALVSTSNKDFRNEAYRAHWDSVITPHAIFLAAPMLPRTFSKWLLRAERVGTNLALYQEATGWLDGLHVKGAHAGVVVPVYLALDQAMIALASSQILSVDGMTVGSRTIFENPAVKERLELFYWFLERKILTVRDPSADAVR